MGRNHRIGAQMADGHSDWADAAESGVGPETPQRARSSRTRTLPYFSEVPEGVRPSRTGADNDPLGAFDDDEAPIPLVNRARESTPPPSDPPRSGSFPPPSSRRRTHQEAASFPEPVPSSRRRAAASNDEIDATPFFHTAPAAQADDDDLWPVDPVVLEVWMKRRGRRRTIKALGWLCVVASLVGVGYLGTVAKARGAIASWATMGQVEETQVAVLRAKMKSALPY
jgi:hypothetical protein